MQCHRAIEDRVIYRAISAERQQQAVASKLDRLSMGSDGMAAFAPSSESRSRLLVTRRRDRRQTIDDLLLTITRAIDRREGSSAMRSAFEKALGRALPVRGVHLRDPANRWSHWSAPGEPKSGGGPGTKSIVVEVPGSEPGGPGVLETTLDVPTALSDWDFQILGLAAGIGALVLEVERLRSQLSRAGLLTTGRTRRDGAAPLIGSTPVMQALRATIERVAATDFTVLLEGESGVGKELVARQIHELSWRRAGPFVAINCAALVETLLEAELFGIEDRIATGVRARRGKFEAADGGTLFLDEVSDLSPSAQAKLLRAIQDLAVERVGGSGARRIDIRIVAATNRRLADLVHQKAFRPDLYYRLSGVDVRVPCLRERRADIPELARYFLARHRTTRQLRLSPEAMDALVTYAWPGNVRELERLVERTIALAAGEVIELEDLPPLVGGAHVSALGPSLERNDTLRAWARRYVRVILERHGGRKRETAGALGISYHTLQAYLRERFEEPSTERSRSKTESNAADS